MKGTLKDQLIAAVNSGELEIPKPERKEAQAQPKVRTRPKLNAHLQDRDIPFLRMLAVEGRKQSSIKMQFPGGFGDVKSFLAAVYEARKTSAISDVDNFFCLTAFARLKPKTCGKDWYFRQRLTVAAVDIFIRIKKRSSQSLSPKDSNDFESIFKTVRSFINDDEFDRLLDNYEKRRVQEEYSRRQTEIARCSEIEHRLALYDFERAERLYQKYKGVVAYASYQDLVKKYEKQSEIAKRFSEIERRLSVYDFERAERFYQRYKGVLDYAPYQELVRKYEAKNAEEKLCQINRFLERFDFDRANKAYLAFSRIIPREKYEKTKLSYQEKYSLKMLDQIVMPYLRGFNFPTAEMLYAEHRDIIRLKHYEEAKAEALIKKLESKIIKFLQEGDYASADDLAGRHPEFPKERYLALKVGFVSRHVSSMGRSRFTPVEVREFSKMILREDPALVNSLNSQKIGRFILHKLPGTVSPPGLYIFAIEQLLEDIKKETLAVESEKVFLAACCFMESDRLLDKDKRSLWLLFCAYPSVLQEFINKAAPQLDKVADAYPYDQINDISDIYLPLEQFSLRYLNDDPLKFNTKSLRSLRAVFEKNRYVNSEMVVALFEAVLDGKQIHLRDILHGLLRQIVNRAFDYRLRSKAKIVNHIFPRCISETGSGRFAISDRDLIFCEGLRVVREDGTVYMRCRNHMCHERTEHLNKSLGSEPDCSFFELVNSVFGFSPDKIFANEDCSLAMGSFNRWNEIAERLVCGYPDRQGCGSPLTFDSINKGRPGWQAYATTYWHCSNETCYKQETIKISHCRGCGKIIDSRIDIYSCPRKDGIHFYVCKNCGYCCDQHGVSGICPHCGNISLTSDDHYGSVYRCENEKCGKTVKTPLWLPEAKKNTLRNNQDGPGNQTALEFSFLDDDIPFDDIPF